MCRPVEAAEAGRTPRGHSCRVGSSSLLALYPPTYFPNTHTHTQHDLGSAAGWGGPSGTIFPSGGGPWFPPWVTSGGEGLAPREGGGDDTVVPPALQGGQHGSLQHGGLQVRGWGAQGSTLGFVLGSACPSLSGCSSIPLSSVPQQLPLSPSCVPTPSSSVPPLSSALGGFGPLLSSSAAPCPGGSGGEGGARVLVPCSHAEDQRVGGLRDPGRGLPGGWTSECV